MLVAATVLFRFPSLILFSISRKLFTLAVVSSSTDKEVIHIYLNIGFEKKDPSEKNTFAIRIQSLQRKSNADLIYLLYPKEWQSDRYNNTIKLSWDHQYAYHRGSGNINLSLRSSTLGSDYDYSDLKIGRAHV